MGASHRRAIESSCRSRKRKVQGLDASSLRVGGGYMDTGLYRDIVYTEYMLEHDLTWEQMMEKTHTDEMLKRVAHMEWQDEQRTAWMSGDSPQYTVPEDCPF